MLDNFQFQDTNLSYRASVSTGHKTVEMNSSVMTDTEDDPKEDTINSKTEETVIDIPEENKATTSTGGTPTNEVTNKEESVANPTTDPTLNETEVAGPEATQSNDKAPTQKVDPNPAIPPVEASPDADVPPKEPNV